MMHVCVCVCVNMIFQCVMVMRRRKEKKDFQLMVAGGVAKGDPLDIRKAVIRTLPSPALCANQES